MSDSPAKERLHQLLSASGVDAKTLDALASQLLWRIGRLGEDGPVTVRVGFAAYAHLFAELPRLKSATDAELEAAVAGGEVRVEWVGALPHGAEAAPRRQASDKRPQE